MATDSKAAKGKNSTPDEDDEGDIDLGASSLPQASLKSPKENFEMVNLDADEEDENDVDVKTDDRRKKRFRKKKKKKEQLSDSSSEDESGKEGSAMEDINPSDLTWPLYLWYYMVAVSTGALKAAEYLGEKLAYFFGITSPKYQHVIDEYYRLKELEREEEERETREKEYVAKVEAERIKNLEGGEKSSEILTISEENNKLPTTTTLP